MNLDLAPLGGLILFLIPLFLLQLALLVIAILDLVKREHVTGGNKLVWALVIIFINVIGPIVYLIAGRKDSTNGGH
jgi:hypothetical protein